MKTRQTYALSATNKKMKLVQATGDQIGAGGNWIVSVRTALGMTQDELADRIGVTKRRLAALEEQEKTGSIKLSTLQGIAHKLGMTLFYGFGHPNGVEDARHKQASRIAKYQLTKTHHTMQLEDQSISKVEQKEIYDQKIDELLRDQPSYFWREEYDT